MNIYFPIEKQIGSRATRATPGGSLRERLAAARQKQVVEPVTVDIPEKPASAETSMIENTEPDSQIITRQVDSKVLGRVVDMVLDRHKPNDVIFDGVHYTTAEMAKLKGLDRESLIVAHDIKREFEGGVKP